MDGEQLKPSPHSPEKISFKMASLIWVKHEKKGLTVCHDSTQQERNRRVTAKEL